MALARVVLFLHPYSHTLNPSSINLPERILIQIITNRSLVTIKRSDDRFGDYHHNRSVLS